jgi:TrmH family RNA methyltransferase
MTQTEIKKAASLAHSKYRKKHGLFLVEGLHSVAELLKSSWGMESLIIEIGAARDPEVAAIISLAESRRLPVHRINKKIFEHIAATESPQGAMAIAVIPVRDLRKVISKPRLLVADQIADPGNLGAIIRSALAFGFGGLIATTGSADIFNPKVVRATQGAMFHLTLAGHADPAEIVSGVKPTHKFFALIPRGGEDLRLLRPPARFALVVGSEATGISPELTAASDTLLAIPMPGGVESLNASVAAAIAMYEFSRK